MTAKTTVRPATITLGLVTFVMVVGLLVYPMRAQEASRLALTGALVERNSIVLDGFPIGIDRAVKDGRTYSDKAPGQPFLAIPVYAVTQLIGLPDAIEPNIDRNLTLWLVTFGTVTTATLALVLVGRMLASSQGAAGASWSVAALVTGTVLLPFSTLLFAHVLAATLLTASFVALRRSRPFLGGFLAGLAVTVDYTTAIGVAILAGWIVWHHPRGAWRFVAGGTGPAIALAAYNTVAFGSPLRFSYQYSAFGGAPATAEPILGIFAPPTIDNLILLLVSGRGLIIASPIIVAALIGSGQLLRDAATRDLSLVGLLMFGSFLLLPIFWANPFGGDSPGPRYLAPALVFLAPGLSRFWTSRPILARGLWLISATTMTLATFTDALALTRNDPAGLAAWLRLALDGEWMPNVLGILIGERGNTLFAALALSSLALLVYGMVRAQPTRSRAE